MHRVFPLTPESLLYSDLEQVIPAFPVISLTPLPSSEVHIYTCLCLAFIINIL